MRISADSVIKVCALVCAGDFTTRFEQFAQVSAPIWWGPLWSSQAFSAMSNMPVLSNKAAIKHSIACIHTVQLIIMMDWCSCLSQMFRYTRIYAPVLAVLHVESTSTTRWEHHREICVRMSHSGVGRLQWVIRLHLHHHICNNNLRPELALCWYVEATLCCSATFLNAKEQAWYICPKQDESRRCSIQSRHNLWRGFSDCM